MEELSGYVLKLLLCSVGKSMASRQEGIYRYSSRCRSLSTESRARRICGMVRLSFGESVSSREPY